MRIGQEFGSFAARIGQRLEPLKMEVQAYRSIVDKNMAVIDSGLPPLGGPYVLIRGAARIIGRLGSEVYGAIEYPIERRTEGNTPEKILQHSQKKIAGWQEFGKSPTHTS